MKCSSEEREMISGPAQRRFYRPISVSHQLLSYCLTVLLLSYCILQSHQLLSYCLTVLLLSYCLTVLLLSYCLTTYMSYCILQSHQLLSYCIATVSLSYCLTVFYNFPIWASHQLSVISLWTSHYRTVFLYHFNIAPDSYCFAHFDSLPY